MTHGMFGASGDDTPRDEPGQGRREGAADAPSGPDPDFAGSADQPFDEEAAWRSIVEHYGDRAEIDDDEQPVADEPPPAASTSAGPFDRSYLDAQESRVEPQAWSDEGHFVPPEPPPVPRGTPARRLAWLGLFGAPLAMLAAVVFGWVFPPWLVLLLVVAFVGGFVFLVATMPRDRDDWSGDDGAVV